jgi:hypothetical protein
LTFGDIEFNPFDQKSEKGTVFFNSSLYGTGLLSAYYKAEAQQWIGCFLEETMIHQHINAIVINELVAGAHVFTLAPTGINEALYNNLVKRVDIAFTRHLNGNTLNPVVQPKIDNIINFFGAYRNKQTLVCENTTSSRWAQSLM